MNNQETTTNKDGASDRVVSTGWLGLTEQERKFIDATIMALHHASGGSFSDYCEDSDFGNDLLEWLHEQKKRITTRPNNLALPHGRGATTDNEGNDHE